MKIFEYTYASIADAAGKTSGALRADITRGRLDPEDLLSVGLYVAVERLEMERRKDAT